MSLQRVARYSSAISPYFLPTSAEVKSFTAVDILYSLAGASQARCSHTLASCRPRCPLTPGPPTSPNRAPNDFSATLKFFRPSGGYLPASSSGEALQHHLCNLRHKGKRGWLTMELHMQPREDSQQQDLGRHQVPQKAIKAPRPRWKALSSRPF